MDLRSFYKKQGYKKENITDRVIAFGSGTQSIAMTLMAMKNKFDTKPDFAVFSDTQAEPESVYNYYNYFTKKLKEKYDFNIYKVSQGNILKDIEGNKRMATLPYFVKKENNKKGMMLRQCTSEYKIKPFHSFLKNHFDIPRKNKNSKPFLEIWFAISTDEMSRIRESDKWYAVNRYPLIEKNIHRKKSIDYVVKNGYDRPPRSACVVCPYRSDKEWMNLTKEELEVAVDFEKKVNNKIDIKEKLFLHSSLKDLDKVDFNKNKNQLEFGFVNECEGYCGI